MINIYLNKVRAGPMGRGDQEGRLDSDHRPRSVARASLQPLATAAPLHQTDFSLAMR